MELQKAEGLLPVWGFCLRAPAAEGSINAGCAHRALLRLTFAAPRTREAVCGLELGRTAIFHSC